MDAWFAGVHEATIELLTAAGYDVVVPSSQTCCGALAAHDGWADDARRMAAVNVAAFGDVDLIVANSAGCGAHLKEYQHWASNGEDVAGRTRDITEVVADAIAAGDLPTLEPTGDTVAIQDPCHLRHAQRITEPPRAILRAAGLNPVEIDPGGQCCGAAGLYSVLEPEMSRQLGEDKADQVRASQQTVVASANPGCEMQLRTYLQDDARIAHPIELYRDALRTQTRR
jgi:glycolate oxidase iron-sulfur subunit